MAKAKVINVACTPEEANNLINWHHKEKFNLSKGEEYRRRMRAVKIKKVSETYLHIMCSKNDIGIFEDYLKAM